MVAFTTGDSTTVFIFVIGILLGLTGFLAVLILNDIRKQLNRNSNHLVRLARASWGILVRQTDVEEHLKERDDYKPVRIKDSDPPVL